jgi:ParB family chromosome partitioning protein
MTAPVPQQHPIVHHVVRVPIASVVVTDARRATLKEGVIEMFSASIERRGLLSPIRLRPSMHLVCGLHRLVAHERLGLGEIDAIICEGDDVDVELDELEENLARKELTVLERARDERRRRELYLQIHPDTRRGAAGAAARHAAPGVQAKRVSFARDAAAPGSGERMVQQRIQVAEALTDQTVALIADTPLANNHRQLLELARLPAPLRHEAAHAVVEGAAKSIADATRRLTHDGITQGTPRAARQHAAKSADGLLLREEDGSRARVVLGGRRLAVVVPDHGTTVSVIDEGPHVEHSRPSQDQRVLTVENSMTAVSTVLDELPGDLRSLVSCTEVEEDPTTSCEVCGSTQFWCTYGLAFVCSACNQRAPRRWNFSRRDVSHARRHQVITVYNALMIEREEILLSWWLAKDIYRAMKYNPAVADTVLVEVQGISLCMALFIGAYAPYPSVDDLKVAVRRALMEAISRRFQLRTRNGKVFRDDGTEILFFGRTDS